MSDQIFIPGALKSPASHIVAFLNFMWSICNDISNYSSGMHSAAVGL